MARIFLGNIPFTITDADLQKFAADNGVKATGASVAMRGTRSLGFGYVNVADADTAAKALEALGGKEIGGRKARVEVARPEVARTERPARVPRAAAPAAASTTGDAAAAPRLRQPRRRPVGAAAIMRPRVDGPLSETTIHVGNLPFLATDADLMNVFDGFLPKSAHVVIVDGRSRGYGFVDFANPADAKKAMEGVEGTQVEGREITLALARQHTSAPRIARAPRAPRPTGAAPAASAAAPRAPREPRERPARVPRVPATDRVKSLATVHVGKLAYSATEEDLKVALAKFNPKIVKIVTRMNGQSRGYAFVEFENADAAKAALAANDMEIKGMKIHVDIAFDKVEPAVVPAVAETKK